MGNYGMLKYCLPIVGLMSKNDLSLFHKYQNHNGLVVNLGVYHGLSVYELCQIYGDDKVIGIDTFTWVSEEFKHYFPTKQFVTNNLLMHRCKPLIFECDSRYPPDWIKNVGVLFIDTCHISDVVRGEIKTWMPRLRDDALIFFHDYHLFHEFGYPAAIDDLMKYWKKLEELDQMVVFGQE